MNSSKTRSGKFILLAAFLGSCPTPPIDYSFPEVSDLTPKPDMPDPLTLQNGDKVSSRLHWVKTRRPELKALFEHYIYGKIPRKPADFHAQVVSQFNDFLDGRATLKLLRLETGETKAPKIDLILIVP